MTPVGMMRRRTTGRQHHKLKHGQRRLSGGTLRSSVPSTLSYTNTFGVVPGRDAVDVPQTELNVNVSITPYYH